MPFIIRHKEGNRTVVVLKYAALFYWLMWPTLFLSVLAAVGRVPCPRLRGHVVGGADAISRPPPTGSALA